MTPMQARLIAALEPERVVPTGIILARVWPATHDSRDRNNVGNLVSQARKALGVSIVNVKRKGYRLEAPCTL